MEININVAGELATVSIGGLDTSASNPTVGKLEADGSSRWAKAFIKALYSGEAGGAGARFSDAQIMRAMATATGSAEPRAEKIAALAMQYGSGKATDLIYSHAGAARVLHWMAGEPAGPVTMRQLRRYLSGLVFDYKEFAERVLSHNFGVADEAVISFAWLKEQLEQTLGYRKDTDWQNVADTRLNTIKSQSADLRRVSEERNQYSADLRALRIINDNAAEELNRVAANANRLNDENNELAVKVAALSDENTRLNKINKDLAARADRLSTQHAEDTRDLRANAVRAFAVALRNGPTMLVGVNTTDIVQDAATAFITKMMKDGGW